MSRNQIQALELAGKIAGGRLESSNLSDFEWNLLLLAAGVNNPCSWPMMVANQVLRHFSEKSGYFAEYRDPLDANTRYRTPALAVG